MMNSYRNFAMILSLCVGGFCFAQEGHCSKTQCKKEVLYLDDFAKPVTEDPNEPFNIFGASNWVTPRGIDTFFGYTQESYSRKNGVYTLYNKGINLISNQNGSVPNYKALSNSFAIKKGETQRYTAEISCELDLSDVPEAWYPYFYNHDLNLDPRPADSGFILVFLQPEEDCTLLSGVTGCYFFAKNAVWAYHDSATYNLEGQFVGSRPFFSHATKVAEFDLSKKHTYEIEYHRGHNPKDSYIKWIVDGKEVRKVTNLGFLPKFKKCDIVDVLAIDVPCSGLQESRLDPSLGFIWIETGQQAHSLQAIVCDGIGLSPNQMFGAYTTCYPTTFVLPEPQSVTVDSSLSIYRLEVTSCRDKKH